MHRCFLVQAVGHFVKFRALATEQAKFIIESQSQLEGNSEDLLKPKKEENQF